MNKALRVVLVALALVGTYSAMTTTGTRAGTGVIFADGSDPMPCNPTGCHSPN